MGEVMLFEYLGFTVHRLAMRSYLVTGPGLLGYIASLADAVNFIDSFLAGQCYE
jgi:hypothetical protein